jgi:hypothetical protein
MKVIFSLFDWSDNFPAAGSRDYRIQNTYLYGIITPFVDDDRVLAWELHNEPDHYQTWEEGGADKVIAWAQQTAATIKALDPRHPITIGVGQYANLWRPGPNGVTLLDISDFVSFHCYDAGGLAPQIAAIKARTNKPIFLGELGWPSGPAKKSTAQTTFDEATQTFLYTTMLRVASEQRIAGVAQYTPGTSLPASPPASRRPASRRTSAWCAWTARSSPPPSSSAISTAGASCPASPRRATR